MAGLYIHIPFCRVKCHYCDFTAFSGQGRMVGRYLDALAREADLRTAGVRSQVTGVDVSWPSPSTHNPSPITCTPSPAFETLYIGGGTPSELDPPSLGRLLNWISGRWGAGGSFQESTFEANPESLEAEKIGILADWGLTRLSLGLQAAQDRLLRVLGRRHDFKTFLGAYREARAAFPSLNIDLMFALPGQDLKDWAETLDRVSELSPDHVSLYGLRIEERTVFARKSVRTDEGLGAEMYLMAVDRMTEAGYRHYEISNFARPGHESFHNLGYWRNGPYLGLGCGAASYLEGVRQTNEPSLPGYVSAIESGRPAVVHSEELEGKTRLGETIFLGLRQVEGMVLTEEMTEIFGPAFLRQEQLGLLERGNGRIRLTRKGLLLANQVSLEFVPPFEE